MTATGGGHPAADLGMYVLDALPADEVVVLRRHLESCGECRRRVDELEGLSELLSAARLVPDAPAGLAESVLTTLPPQAPPPAPGTTGTHHVRAPDAPPASGLGTPVRTPGRAPSSASPPHPALTGGDAGALVFGKVPTVADDAAAHRNRRIVVVASVTLIAALTVAAAVLLIAPRPTSRSVPLQGRGGASVTGSVSFGVDAGGTGTTLQLHADGLGAGDYVVTVGDHDAGGFSTPGGSVAVGLHTGATSGLVAVTATDDTDTPVATATIG